MDLRLVRRHRRKSRRETAELAAQLAPPEEQEAKRKAARSSEFQGAHHELGAIVVDNGTGGISEDLIDGGNEKRLLGLEPVVIAIVGILLAWMLFIAWKISEMPSESLH